MVDIEQVHTCNNCGCVLKVVFFEDKEREMKAYPCACTIKAEFEKYKHDATSKIEDLVDLQRENECLKFAIKKLVEALN